MERRLSRRCVRNKKAVPSAVHYVGYVEDDETPEMIMKKFEELERIRAGATAAKLQNKPHEGSDGNRNTKVEGSNGVTPENGGEAQPHSDEHASKDQTYDPGQEESLNDQLLLEVFKQTSIFNIKSAMHNNDLLHADENNFGERVGGSDDEMCSDSEPFPDDAEYLQGFWTDDDGDAGRRRLARPDRERGPRATREGQARHVRQQVVTQYNKDTHAFIRRRAKAMESSVGLQQIRIPAPMPLSWARTVQPYEPTPSAEEQVNLVTEIGKPGGQGPEDAASFETANLDSFPWTSLGKQYQAVMIGGGWWGRAGERSEASAREETYTGDRGCVSHSVLLQRLSRVPLERLCPQGFLFVWVEKLLIQGVTQGLARRGYSYVENLTWVFRGHNNEILKLGESAPSASPEAADSAAAFPANHVSGGGASASTASIASESAQAPKEALRKNTYDSRSNGGGSGNGGGSASLFFRRSHATLLIFRREGKDIELRHQRSPDVVFDCVQAPGGKSGCQWATPPEVYTTIETMLPTGKGKLLEVWAPVSTTRTGWDRVVEIAG